MYVASSSEKDWLLSAQRKLYARSHEQPDYVFCKLWGLITDPRNLRIAFARVASNRGGRTAGVDGLTVREVVAKGADAFLDEVRKELREGAFRPSPVRRVLIPKPGQPWKFRPLGIPTVRDRVVQAAVKNILEPIFEADFYPSSFGFRPGRSAHGALEELRKLLLPHRAKTDADPEIRFPYQWAIEGDIKGCFDNISHHGLMERVRKRVSDAKVNRLVVAFLKAGVLAEEQFLRSTTGTPQGGILSPLLANIALSVIDNRYERHAWPRRTPTLLHDAREVQLRAAQNRNNDKRSARAGRVVLVPVRYADDFIVLVSAPNGPDQHERAHAAALAEKAALAKVLKETLNLELSEEKTAVTPVTSPMRFLGHHVRVQRSPMYGWTSKCVIPKDRSQRLRSLVRKHFGGDTRSASLKKRLDLLNPMLRGWSAYYRHAWGAKRVFSALDSHVWWTIRRWLIAKHVKVNMHRLYVQYGWRKPGGRTWRWRDRDTVPFEMVSQRVERYRHGWMKMKAPGFASTSRESPVHNERCTPGSDGGARKPTGASRVRRRAPTKLQ
jgi:group II intron reverse transcriptase/maturase